MIRWIFWYLASCGAAVACEVTGRLMEAESRDAPNVYTSIGDIPLAQPFSILLTVCTDRVISELGVDAIMPAHRHGLNYTPRITALGNGVFRVDEMLFHMPGQWELQVDVNFDGQSASYISSIALK